MENLRKMDDTTIQLKDLLAYSRVLASSNNQSKDAIFKIVHQILNFCIVNDDDLDCKNSAMFLKDVINTYPSISYIMISFIPLLANPKPFLEIIPSLFTTADSEQINDVFLQLREILKGDNRLFIPILSALIELPLPNESIKYLSSIAENSLSIIESDDLPILYKLVLKSMEHINTSSLYIKLRSETINLPMESLVLVLEMLWEILPSSYRSADILLEHIYMDIHSKNIPTMHDTIILLILISTAGNGGRYYKKAYSVMNAWLTRGEFPFDLLGTMITLKRSNEVWDRLLPAIWTMCIWAIDTFSLSLSVSLSVSLSLKCNGEKNDFLATTPHFIKGLSKVISQIFQSCSFYRETVISSLLDTCLAPNIHLFRYDKNGEVTFTVLGSIDPNPGCKEFESNKISCVKYNEQLKLITRGEINSIILCNLSRQFPEIGIQIFNSFMTRQSPKSDGNLVLPHLNVLVKITDCIIKAIPKSPQIENTLLIIIQKYLCIAPSSYESELLARILFSKKTNNVNRNFFVDNKIISNDMNGFNNYSQISIGFILAKQFLVNWNQLSMSDIDLQALIRWTCKSVDIIRDYSLYYALDFFSKYLQLVMLNASSQSSIIETSNVNNIFFSVNKVLLELQILKHGDGLIGKDFSDNLKLTFFDTRYLVCDNLKSSPENVLPTREIAWDLRHISHKIVTNVSCPTASDQQVSMALYSICWIIYKFSVLENQKNALSSSSKYENGNLCMKVTYLTSKFESSRSSKSQVVVETRSRSSSKRKSHHEEEEDPNFIPVDYGIVKISLPKKTGALNPTSLEVTTNELWTWSCSSTSMIITSYDFHLYNSDLIKFAWERTLLCSILLGNITSSCPSRINLTKDTSIFDTLLLKLSQYFCQVSWSRHYSRAVLISTQQPEGSSVKLKKSSRQELSNAKSSLSSGSNSFNVNYKIKDSLKFKNIRAQLRCIQNVLSHSVTLIPNEVLVYSFRLLFNIDPTDDLNFEAYNIKLHRLSTDFGLCLTSCLSFKVLSQTWSNNLWDIDIRIKDSSYELFHGDLNNPDDKEAQGKSLWDSLNIIGTYIPGMYSLLKKNQSNELNSDSDYVAGEVKVKVKVHPLTADTTTFINSMDYFLGQSLTHDGLVFLIVTYFVLLDFKMQDIKHVHINEEDFELNKSKEFIQSIQGFNFSSKKYFHAETDNNNNNNNNSNHHSDSQVSSIPVFKSVSSSSHQIENPIHHHQAAASFYINIENYILETKSFNIALSGMRILTRIVEDTLIYPRITALSWKLLTVLYTEKLNFYTSSHEVGFDHLSLLFSKYFESYPSMELNFKENFSIREKNCRVLLRSYLNTAKNKSNKYAKTKESQTTFEIFKSFWFNWLALEKDKAYLGVSVAIVDLFAIFAVKENTHDFSRSKKSKFSNGSNHTKNQYISKVIPYFNFEILDAYFNLIFSSIPSILSYVKPKIPDKENRNDSDESTPYSSIIHTLQLLMWIIREFEILIDSKNYFSFILKTSVTSIRVCKILLYEITYLIESCIDWRNHQQYPEKSDKEDCLSDASASGNENENDWGDLSYLEPVIDLAYKFGEILNKFSKSLKEKIILPGTLEVPYILIKILPSFSNEVLIYLSKITRIVKTQGLEISSLEPDYLNSVSNSFKSRMDVFISCNHNVLSSPVASSLFVKDLNTSDNTTNIFSGIWGSNANNSRNSDSAKSSFDFYFDLDRVRSNKSKSSNDDFVALVSQKDNTNSHGWGIYSFDSQVDDSQSEDINFESSNDESEEYGSTESDDSSQYSNSDDSRH